MSDRKTSVPAISTHGGQDFHAQAQSLAETWIAAWNSHDLERVLALFTEDVVFTSPKAVPIMGRATVVGKEQLRAYWTAGLQRAEGLHFTLLEVVADQGSRALAIVYEGETTANRYRAVELLHLDESGRIASGEAMVGAEITGPRAPR
jgi:ketosteroid isomerase-like protein